MNTNPQTKPSAGALRAAEAFVKWGGQTTAPEYVKTYQIRLAEIIDAESGLAEALDALLNIEANLMGCDYIEERIADSLRRCKAAIAKASNPNATVTQAARWGAGQRKAQYDHQGTD